MTKLPLRLEKILSHISPCDVLADTGTDHAKIPVAAVERGLCRFALATDKSTEASRRAAQYIKSRGLTDSIRTLHGDGLRPLFDDGIDQNVNCLIIAGMGGILISEILDAGLRSLLDKNPFHVLNDRYQSGRSGDRSDIIGGANKVGGLRQIILLPHRDVALARDTLLRHGLGNISDDLFTDKGKAYHILDCRI
jgi:tRNA A22 N-methylase